MVYKKKVKSARGYPSTSSGRAQQDPGLVFTTEPVEVSGRAQRSPFLKGSPRSADESGGKRAQRDPGLVFAAEPVALILELSQRVSERTYVIAKNQQQNHTFVFDQQTKETDVMLRFEVEAYATLTVHILIMHVSVRVKIECILRGQGAHAAIYGAYIASGNHSIGIETFQHHQVAHTSSTLIMRGALRDCAQANYNGTIRIEKDARESNASQENKNILLSNSARAVSVPNLEVLNNEVKCFHASAVGKFDEDQLFYAAARGIDEKIAEQLLLEAFFHIPCYDFLHIGGLMKDCIEKLYQKD